LESPFSELIHPRRWSYERICTAKVAYAIEKFRDSVPFSMNPLRRNPALLQNSGLTEGCMDDNGVEALKTLPASLVFAIATPSPAQLMREVFVRQSLRKH
jgi:hypothetical protein